MNNFRFNYTEQHVKWADIVIPTGGDGTFLLAASRVKTNEKPVMGFNSDPAKSEGHLCVSSEYSKDVDKALLRIKKVNEPLNKLRFSPNHFQPFPGRFQLADAQPNKNEPPRKKGPDKNDQSALQFGLRFSTLTDEFRIGVGARKGPPGTRPQRSKLLGNFLSNFDGEVSISGVHRRNAVCEGVLS